LNVNANFVDFPPIVSLTKPFNNNTDIDGKVKFTCEISDEVEEGYVERNGIIIKENLGTKTWRKAKVLKVGRLAQDVKPGDTVVYPSDKGIRMVGTSKKRYIFLNESRIFYIE
jgi:co-chaperonin GroES (HSP10)